MIKGLHAMFYTSKPKELREFFRDKLELDTYDSGDGWLISNFAEADMGAHPVDYEGAPTSGTLTISFYTDDINKTVARLKENGVDVADITDAEWGFVTQITAPGDFKIDLYQPKYTKR